MADSRRLVDKLWSYCNVLRDDGVGVIEYTKILVRLAQQPGTLGTIYRKAQNRIQDPAKLKKLVVDLIDKENRSASDTELNGDAYEELLSKGASDKGSGAGQYCTPCDLIRAIVDVVEPAIADSVVDPATMRNFDVS